MFVLQIFTGCPVLPETGGMEYENLGTDYAACELVGSVDTSVIAQIHVKLQLQCVL